MKLTVKSIMKLEPLKDADIIAGHNGLSNVVTSVSVLEIPKHTVFLREGEISISSFYSIANDVDKQLEVIRMLKESNISGLILCHIGIFLPSISRSVVELCNELDFPLIIPQPNVAYIDIISSILDSLFNIKNNELSHAMKVHDAITNLLLEEKDLDELISTLHTLINRPIYFFDHNNECISSSNGSLSSKYDIYLKQNIQDCLSNFTNYKDIDPMYIDSIEKTNSILLIIIANNKMYYGTLVVFNANDLNDLDLISINQIKNSIAITSLNKIRIRDYNILLKHDYLDDLIAWNFESERTALKRGLNFGYDVSKIRFVMVIDIFNFSKLAKKYSERDLQEIKSHFYNTVKNELSYFTPKSIIRNYSDKVVVFFCDCDAINNKNKLFTKKRILKISEHIRQSLTLTNKLPVSIGIGQYCKNISQIKNSYHEALSAIRISNQVFKTPRCTFFDEIELFWIILENHEVSKVCMVIDRMFLPLKTYDEENNTQLLLTFKMLLENDMDVKTVSEKMFLHRNTILQRKNRIIEIFGYDPFIVPYRTQFEIAMIIDNFC